ncbi:MAG: FHA domain-containing protein [Deltaproteobacteria bacterium]|nr:FHA domain-containing protein [Deltaproteobacteria bacterium]
MLGLDWSLGAEDRAAYQTGSITEFLAELNLMYVTAGPKLRAHIESFPEGSPERQAWDFAYGEMKSRIFEGIEYGYDADYRPAASVKSAKPAGKKAEVPAPEKTEILPVQINTPPPKPVIGTVEMALADNAPGAGRKGKAGKSQGTEEYGTFSVITDEGTGYHKDHNEDGYVLGRNWGLVLDGMGGMGSGDKASEIAGKKFAEEMSAHGDLLRATLAAGRAINESPYHSGGTTSVAHQIVKRADGTYVAKLVVTGDAAAILFRRDANGKYVYDPKLRTEEQSQAALLRKAGRITNTLQARASDIANVVTGGLGLGREAKPDTYEYEIRKGDYLLSFSDGIGDNVSGEELARILNNSRSAGEVQDKISDLVHWKMEKLAKARAVAKGRSQEGVMVDSFVDSEDRFHWRVELNDMPGYTIDEKGHVYDSAGKMVDHYKSDNLTIHVYSHDVLEPPAGRASEVTVTMPVVDIADQKTLILQLPKVEPRWTSNGEWVLPKGFRSTTIGSDRSKGAQILMPDPLVSRQHAEIFESEGELWIRDKGSLNGTFVDGKRLSGEEAHVLDSGTLVSFGGRSYQFDVVGDQAKLTPVLAVSPGQGTVNFGGITLLEGDPGVYFIRNEGKGPVQVDGASLEANGQAYRIRDRESVKLGQQNFIFRIQ